MSEQAPQINVQEAFDPALRQAQKDMNGYLEQRPDNASQAEWYHDALQQQLEDLSDKNIPYEEMSMPDLARKLAEAEHYDDKTTATNVSDVLLEKLAEFEEKNASSREGRPEDHNANQSDNVWNRVMAIKEKTAAELAGASPVEKPEAKKSPSGKSPEADSSSKEDLEDIFVRIYYTDGKANIQPAKEITREGYGINLRDLDGREAIIVDEDGNEYYVKGNDLENLTKIARNLENGTFDEDDGHDLEEDFEKNEPIIARVGDKIVDRNGKEVTGTIKQIEYTLDPRSEDDFPRKEDGTPKPFKWQNRGSEDKFKKARELLKKYDEADLNDEVAPQPKPTPSRPEPRPKTVGKKETGSKKEKTKLRHRIASKLAGSLVVSRNAPYVPYLMAGSSNPEPKSYLMAGKGSPDSQGYLMAGRPVSREPRAPRLRKAAAVRPTVVKQVNLTEAELHAQSAQDDIDPLTGKPKLRKAA